MEGLDMGQSFNPPLRYHVIPIGDLREHEPSPKCWCHPTPDEEHDYYRHHALDGREAYETGERKPN